MLLPVRPEYYRLYQPIAEIKNAIFHHPEITVFGEQMVGVFDECKTRMELERDVIDQYPNYQLRK